MESSKIYSTAEEGIKIDFDENTFEPKRKAQYGSQLMFRPKISVFTRLEYPIFKVEA